ILIPYSGPAKSFEYISYIDVIRGNIPAKDTFKNKYVLIGATAIGIGDQYATPASGKTHLMPGVEILANVTDALLHDISIRAATNYQNAILNLLFVGIALIGFVLLSPFFALLLTTGLALALLLTTYFAAGLTGILFAPAAGVLGLMIIYPLWSWHRLSTAARFLAYEFESFQKNEAIPFTANKRPLVRDFLDRRIVAVEAASQQLQSLHKFIINSLDNLPYPTLISGVDGFIRIANHSAARHFHVPNAAALVSQYLPALVADIVSNELETRMIAEADILVGSVTVEGEAKDSENRDLIVKCVPIMNAENLHTGWILSVVDISKLRQAERDREEAFRFIAHDIRAPLSSIITLLELRRIQNIEHHEDLMQRLERYADNALAMADGFMNLSRAKSGEYRFDDIDLASLLAEVVDEAWASSQKRNIHIETTTT
ncbi:MAG: CHASE2 domain-containing protein, partial [Nitrosomonadales bacterium]|nr:CHASE2 domain-containing protein [Nitrosomonadales bacterium]